MRTRIRPDSSRRVLMGLILILLVLAPAVPAAAVTIETNTVIGADDTVTYDGQDLVIGNGTDPVTVTINGNHAFNSLTIQPQATVVHSETDADTVYAMAITVSGDMTVAAGGAIVADGRGYLGGRRTGNASDCGRTSGNVTTGGSCTRAGGSHGGLGGWGEGSTIGSAFDELANPSQPGGGGGGRISYSDRPGGDGGGLVRLTVGGTLTLDGAISADGSHAGAYGGGAGGAIYIKAATFAGSGAISAAGGNAGTYGGDNIGGGGGGRVALYYTALTYSGTVTASGGAGNLSGGNGGAGTVFWRDEDADLPYGRVVVDNGGRAAGEASTPLLDTPEAPTVLEALTFANGGFGYVVSPRTVTGTLLVDGGGLSLGFGLGETDVRLLANTLTLINGATLVHPQTDAASVFKIDVQVTGDMAIDGASGVDVSGRGYLGGRSGGNGSDCGLTSGNVTIDGSCVRAGGSHGGLGGWGEGSTIGSAFDELANPSQPGGGGGGRISYSDRPGGDGGGVVRLSVAGTFTLDGTIAADGATGPSNGGGAGGAINLSTGTLAGSGVIRADGGKAGAYSSDNIGGGGGGRVAIFYTVNGFSGTVSTMGGLGNLNGHTGGAGTVYWKAAGQNHGDLVIANGDRIPAEASTPLLQTDGIPTTYDNVTIAHGARGYATVLSEITGALVMDDGWLTLGYALDDDAARLTAVSASLSGGAVLTHAETSTAAVYKVDLHVTGNMSIDAASTVDVTGRGYLGGRSGGNGSDYGRTWGNVSAGGGSDRYGGSHGGLGGWGEGSVMGVTYGNLSDPRAPGAGGGGYYSYADRPGGDGGGLIRLSVGGTLDLEGSILADGKYPGGGGNGGGAGGGILLQAGTFSGSGLVAARGGRAGAYSSDRIGGGSGGRIAVYTTTDAFSGRITAHGGKPNSSGGFGGAGTIFCKRADQSHGDLIVDNGLARGTWTAVDNETLTDSGTNWGAGDLVGFHINPDINQTATYTVGGNTASALTVSGLPVDSVAVGNGYIVFVPTTNISTPAPGRVFAGTVSTAAGTVLTDDAAAWEPGALVGMILNPDRTQSETFAIVANDATTVTVDTDMGASAVDGAAYAIGHARFDNVTITGGAVAGVDDLPLVVTHNVTVDENAVLTHQDADLTSTNRLNVSADTMTIAAAGRVDVTGRGYVGGRSSGNGSDYGRTLGNATTDGSRTRAGGSHGGAGGSGSGSIIGASYGDAAMPIHPGAGGGGYYSYADRPGGDGGGVVRLAVTDTLTVLGVLTADGINPGSNGNGGGAGGSIYISAATLTGAGAISARGGSAGLYSSDGKGGGGGGRIALYSQKSTFLGTVTVDGGAGAEGGSDGAVGTLHTEPAGVDLSVTQTDSADPVDTGDALTYTFTVTNPGATDATGVALTDTLPAGVTFTSAAPTQGSCSAVEGVVTCQLGAIAAGATVTVDITVSVTDQWTIGNSVILTATELDVDTADNTGSEATVVNPADLALTQTADVEPAIPGQPIVYTLTITNNGWQDAQSVVLTDSVPAAVLNPEFTIDGGVTWNAWTGSVDLGTLANLAVQVVQIRGTVDPAVTAAVTNSAAVDSLRSDPDPTNNSADVTTTFTPQAEVSIAHAAAPDPVMPGTPLTYTFTLANAGPSDATHVILSDAVPAAVGSPAYSLDDGATWTAWPGSIDLGTMIPGASREVRLRGTVRSATVDAIGNTADVAADPDDPAAGNNTTGVITTAVAPTADLAVTMIDGPDPAVVQYDLTYEVNVTNLGPSDALNPVLTDALPAALTSPVHSLDGGLTWAAWTGSLNLGTIVSGAGVNILLRGKVAAGTTGPLNNACSVTADTSDPDTANNTVANVDTAVADASPVISVTEATTIGALDFSQDGRHVTVGDGTAAATLTVNGTHTFASLTIQPGAVVTHSPTDTATTYSATLHIDGDLTVMAGGAINADDRGYLGGRRSGNASDRGRTTGNTTTDGSYDADGGSHGGRGGNGAGGSTIAPAFGAVDDPVEPGGGGGAWDSNHNGGNGGGLIRLMVAGTLTNDGVVTANGGSPTSGKLGGGGAGGGILVQTAALTGAGRFSADGGAGGTYCCGYAEGGGGGGRIAMHYGTDTFTGVVTAKGGIGRNGGAPGGAGTVFRQQTGQPYGHLVVDNGGQVPAGDSTPLPSAPIIYSTVSVTGSARTYNSAITRIVDTFILDDGWFKQDSPAIELQLPAMDVTNGAQLLVGVQRIDIPALNITNGSVVRHLDTTATQAYRLDLHVAGTLYVDATSRIDTDAQGYLGGRQSDNASDRGRTIGNTATGGSYDADGGSYGGLGGNGAGGDSVVATYGEVDAPADLGSGGGAWDSNHNGGDGGGYIHLTVGGTLTNEGAISARGGSPGSGKLGGGGAGGGILIQTGTIVGGGLISADGGAGGTYCCGYAEAGGGGGRIAIHYTNDAFTGTLSATGGVGQNGGANGGAGTIFRKGPAHTYGELVVGNGGLAAAENTTPLPAASSIAFEKLTIAADASVRAGNLAWVGTLLVDDGWLTLDCSGTAFNAGTITLSHGAVLTQPDTTTDVTYGLYITTAGALLIDDDSRIDVTARGYLGGWHSGNSSDFGRTSGNTTANGSREADGGSHGGYGGDGSSGPTGITYDDLTDPSEPGAGGGAWDSSHIAGDGGGYVNLTVGGTLTVDGGIIAAGGNGGAGDLAGGGAGGGVAIHTRTLNGAGVISAVGGNAGTYCCGYLVGGGGGGRVSLHYGESAYTGTVAAYGGPGYNGGGPGGAGTIFWKARNAVYGDLVVDNNGQTTGRISTPVLPAVHQGTSDAAGGIVGSVLTDSTAAWTPGALAGMILNPDRNGVGTFVITDNTETTLTTDGELAAAADGAAYIIGIGRFNAVSIGRGAYVGLDDLPLIGDLVDIHENVTVSHPDITGTSVSQVAIQAGHLTIDATSRIDVNYRGYLGGYRADNGSPYGRTTGNSTAGGSYHTGGGSHGGIGGTGYQGGPAGTAYGSDMAPAEPGGGGGAWDSANPGGDGGGYVALDVSNTFTFDGVITANGATAGAGKMAGGGAGGGVYIRAGTFTGSGAIFADGGGGGTHSYGSGGGAGGRIAYRYGVDTFTGTMSAVGGSGTNGGTDGGAGTIYTGQEQFADISLTMTDDPDPASVGVDVAYTITVTNDGPADATGVTLSVPIPVGASLVSAAPGQGACSGTDTVTCELGDVADGASATVTLVVTPTAAGTLTATAAVTIDQVVLDPTRSSAGASTLVYASDASADLSVTLTDSPDPVTAGQAVTYTATVTNDGPFDAVDVTLTQVLSAQIQQPQYSLDSGLTWLAWDGSVELGTLTPAATAEIRIRGTVHASALGLLSATATVQSGTEDPDTANNSATQLTTAAAAADLMVSLSSAPSPVPAGAELTSTVTVTNAGPSDALSTELSATTTGALTNQRYSLDNGATWHAFGGTFDMGTVAAGTPRVILLRGTVTLGAVDPVTTAVTVSSGTTDPDATFNAAGPVSVAVTTLADLAVSISDSPDPVTVDDPITYQIQVVNHGPSNAAGVTAILTLPAGAPASAATPTQGTCTGTTTVTCALGVLALNGQANITVTAASTGTGMISATAAVSGDDPDGDAANDTAVAETTVSSNSDLTVSQIALTPATGIVDGQVVTLAATVDNLTDSPSVNPFVVDFLVDGASIGTAAVDSSLDAQSSVTVSRPWTAVPGSHAIAAAADSANAVIETDEANNTLQLDPLTVGAADFTVTELTWSPQAPVQGERLTVTATVSNTGAATLRPFDVAFTVDGTGVGTVTVPGGLGAGAAVTLSQLWTATAGTHTLSVSADSGGQVSEAAEDNNELSQVLAAIDTPDLSVSGITVDPAQPVHGETVTLTATVSNTATATLMDFEVAFAVDGTAIGSVPVSGGLAAGTSVQVTRTWTAEVGAHTVTVSADDTHVVAEADETNNSADLTLAEIPKPDLTVTGITWSPSQPAMGETVTFTATILNSGGATRSPFDVRFDIDGGLIGSTEAAGGIDNGETITITHAWVATAGTHTVTVTADAGAVIPEVLEDNNSATETMAAILAPDLTISQVTWSPASPVDGEVVTFTADVANTGAGSVLSTFYIQFKVGGVSVGTVPVLQGLAGGAGATVSAAWTAAPGTHAVAVRADITQLVTEDSETNNSWDGSLPDIPAADLWVSQLSWVPSPPVDGETATFNAVVANAGSGDTRRSFTVDFDIGGALVASRTVFGLAAGGHQTVSADWTAAAGQFPMTVTADAGAKVAEVDETNNVKSLTLPMIVDATAPAPPTVNPVTSPTRIATQTLSGTKEAGTSIWVNGAAVVALDGATEWSYPVNLAVGENVFAVTARDAADNESAPVSVTIDLDTTAPAPVTTVSVDADGDGTVLQINWAGYDLAANDDVAFFRVYVAETDMTSVAGLTALASVPVSVSGYSATGLTRGTTYYVAVVAVDLAGNAANAVTTVSVTPVDNVAPADVTGIKIVSEAARLVFSWTPPTSADLAGFRVVFDSGEPVALAADQTSFTAANLEPASVHVFRISAVDTDGNESGGVSVVGVTLLPNPVGVTAAPGNGSTTVSWTAASLPAYVRNYNIYLSTGDFTSVTGMTPAHQVTGTTATLQNLTNGQTYHIAVTTVNRHGGEAAEVVPVTVTPVQRPELLSVKANYISPVSAVSDFRLTLRFDSTMDTAVTPVITIINPGGDSPAMPAGGTWVSTNRTNDTYVTPDIALVQGMDGTLSVDVSAAADSEQNVMQPVAGAYTFTVDATPPPAPTLSVLTAGCGTGILSWAAYMPPSDLAGYEIYRAAGVAFTDVTGRDPLGWVSAGQMTFALSGLDAAVDYYAAVVAVDTAGNRLTAVTPVAVRYDHVIPPPITATVTSGADPGVATVSWAALDPSAACGLAGYMLYYQNAPFADVTGMVPQAIVGTDETQVAIGGLDRSRSTYFAVVGFNEANAFDPAVSPTAWSDPFSGEITSDTVIGGGEEKIIAVDRTITVSSGATLTLAAGTRLTFATGTGLIVTDGALVAEGTALAPVVLTAASDTSGGAPQPGDWDGLVLGSSAGGSVLTHVIVRYAADVTVDGAADPTFTAFSALYCSGAGLRVKNGAAVNLTEALIAYNHTGVIAEDTAQLSVTQSAIKGNTVNANGAGSQIVNATANWWGTDDAARIAGRIAGQVNSDGFLTSEPLLTPDIGVAGGHADVGTSSISLVLACRTASEMRLSEDSTFSGVYFQPFAQQTDFELSEGGGSKTIFAEFRSVSGGLSPVVSITVNYITDGPAITQFNLSEGDTVNRPMTVAAQAVAALGIDAVAFYVDGQLADAGAASPYAYRWDVRSLANGIHRVKLLVSDNAGNLAAAERNVTVDVTPPPAPLITAPVDGNITTSETVTVRGKAEPFIDVQITRNGYVMATIQAAADGGFEIAGVGLVEGSNIIAATALDAFGQGPMSNEVAVARDSGAPSAPVALEALVRPWGGIEVSWQYAESGERPLVFDLYRHTAYFGDPSEATLVKADLYRTDHIDFPDADGTYYYALVGFDAAGNASALSNVVTAVYDQSEPGFTVSYDQTPPLGPGTVVITVAVDETLADAPTLTILPAGTYAPQNVALTASGALSYTGSYEITAETPSGVAVVNVSGKDAAGNSFYGRPAGPDCVIDTAGPVGTVTVNASPPVQILTDVGLTVSLTLDEAAKAGTTPRLRFKPPVGGDVSVALTGSGSAWSGTLLLTSAMGKGSGRFLLAVEDGLSNAGTAIGEGEYLEIYNTDTPDPTAPPTQLSAVTEPGGTVALKWAGTDGAERYRVYRVAGECLQAPNELAGQDITGTAYADAPGTDGKYCYGVTADRRGAESLMSNLVSAFVDGTPPNAPENVAVAFGTGGVLVSWDAPPTGEAAYTYRVYRNGARIRSVNGLARSINDFPPAGGQYSYRVASVDWFGNEQLSGAVAINLNVGAVSDLAVVVRQGDVPRFTWSNTDADVIGFNIYRGGIRLNASLITQGAYADTLYAGTSRVTYAVRAVNAEGDESPPRTVDIYPLNITAVTNPDDDGSARAMVAGYFNVLAVTVSNGEATHELNLDQIHLDVTPEDGSPFALTRSVDWRIAPGSGLTEDLVVPVADKTARTLTVSLRQPFEGDSQVSYETSISVDDIVRSGITVDLSTAAVPLAGGYAAVRMCVNNHGFADMDLVVSRGAVPGDLYVVVKNADGLEIGRTRYNGAPEGSRLSADGRGYVTVESGGERCVDVDVLLPENLAAGAQITFEGGVGSTYYDLGTSGEVAGDALTATLTSGISHAPYYGTAGAVQSVYVNDTPVIVTGQAIDRQTQQPLPDTPLKIGFYSRGFKWFQNVTTDDQGDYAYTYVPTRGMSGHFVVWAAHPEVFDTLTQVEFDVYRLYHAPEYGNIRMSKADSMDFQIELYNPGERPLSGFSMDFRAYTVDTEGTETDTATVTGQVLVDAATFTLAPGKKKRITLRLTADADAPSEVGVTYRMQFTPDVAAVFTGNVSLSQAVPILSVETPKAGYVDLSLDRGTIVSRPVTVTNTGLETLQDLEIIPPSAVPWMSLNLAKDASGKYLLGDVAAGASVTFDVVFAPPEDTAFGYHQDHILLRGANVAADYQIGLYGRVTSNKLGAVKFSVFNILGQELVGAKVRMRNMALAEDITPVTTDLYGEVTVADIQEGRWSWQVNAPGHGNEVGVIQVTADQTQFVETILSRNLVTINFKVEPVPYTDRYEIKLEQTFETHVPVPVLVVDPTTKDLGTIRDGFETTYMVNVSNFGLKQMEDVELTTGVTHNSRLEPLVKYLPVLGAMQTVQIPYRYTFNTGLGGTEQTAQSVPSAQSVTSMSVEEAADDPSSSRTALGAWDTAKREHDKYRDCFETLTDPTSGLKDLETIGANINGRGYCAFDRAKPLAVAAFLITFANVTGGAENLIIGTAACLINSIRGWFGGGNNNIGGSNKSGSGSGKPLPKTGSSVGFAKDPACFAAGTPIAMADGTTLPIENIREGQRILSLNGGSDRVRRVYSRMVDRVRELWIATADGIETRRLVATDEHLFRLADKGWTLARDIAVGDAVVLAGGVTGQVVRNDGVARHERVYNFEVDSGHTYYANGSLVYERCWNTTEDPFDIAAAGKGGGASPRTVMKGTAP